MEMYAIRSEQANQRSGENMAVYGEANYLENAGDMSRARGLRKRRQFSRNLLLRQLLQHRTQCRFVPTRLLEFLGGLINAIQWLSEAGTLKEFGVFASEGLPTNLAVLVEADDIRITPSS